MAESKTAKELEAEGVGGGGSEKKSCWERFKYHVTPDKKMIPLKLTIFCYACSAFALLPVSTGIFK